MIADYRTLPVGKRKWCSCIGCNYKLTVSYAFGSSLVVHSRVLIASKMIKWMGAVAFRWPYSLVFIPLMKKLVLRDCNSLKCNWTVEPSSLPLFWLLVLPSPGSLHICNLYIFLIYWQLPCLFSMLYNLPALTCLRITIRCPWKSIIPCTWISVYLCPSNILRNFLL